MSRRRAERRAAAAERKRQEHGRRQGQRQPSALGFFLLPVHLRLRRAVGHDVEEQGMGAKRLSE